MIGKYMDDKTINKQQTITTNIMRCLFLIEFGFENPIKSGPCSLIKKVIVNTFCLTELAFQLLSII